jgi:hypothetical protein
MPFFVLQAMCEEVTSALAVGLIANSSFAGAGRGVDQAVP